MKVRQVFVIIIYTTLANFGLCNAQHSERKLIIQNFTDEHGLPQNSVKSITADNLGFVWLSTEKGLARFDGRTIVDMTNIMEQKQGSRFFEILPDMFGHGDHFYATRYDKLSPRVKDGAISIRDGIAVYDSTFHFYRFLDKIPLFDLNRSHIVTGTPGLNLENYAHDINYTILAVPGRRGCYFRVGREDITFFDNWKVQWKVNNHTANLKDFFCFGTVLYRLDASGQLLRLENGKWSKEALNGDFRSDLYLPGKRRELHIFWNVINKQLFLLAGDRFYLMELQDNHEWRTRLLLSGFSFESHLIRSAYYDESSQSLLLGSTTKGLFVVRQQNFIPVSQSADDLENVFYGQTALDSNRILTPSGQIFGISKKGNAIEISRGQSALRRRAPAEMRFAARDSQGRIWFSSDNFVKVLSNDGQRLLKTFSFKGGISCLFKKPDGEILVSVKSNGLYSIPDLTSKPIPYCPELTFTDVTYIEQPDKNTLWLGTTNGLYKFNTETRKAVPVPQTENYYVRSIHLSREQPGSLFFSTFDDGIFYYNGQNVTQLPLDERTYLASAHCIVQDGHGYLWIPTNRGLFRASLEDIYSFVKANKADQKKLFYLYYAKDSGFLTNEFNGGCQPCAVRLKNGFVSLPSLNGLVLFEPERILPNLPDRALIIDRVSENNLTRLIASDTITLGLNPKNITFYVSTPYFGSPENLHLAYALIPGGKKPEQSDWIPVSGGSGQNITFSQLNSGNYQLWVRKTNGFGLNNYHTSVLHMIVPLNWYETAWFRIFVAAVLMAAIYLLFRRRTQSLIRSNLRLENKVGERTRNLQDTLLSLQTSERELSRQMQVQSRLIASISHDVRTPINFIALVAATILDKIRNNKKQEGEQLLIELHASARETYALVDNLVNFSKSQIYGVHTSAKPVQLRALVEEKTSFFRPMLAERRITFVNELPAHMQVSTSSQLLGIIIHNILDNALKHSPGSSTVVVRGEDSLHGTHLIFADTGNGYPAEIMQWLNNTSEQTNEHLPSYYSGLGLLIIKETAAILNLGLLAENDGGARLTLIFHGQ